MCAISGIYGEFEKEYLIKTIEKMVEKQFHRGPDNQQTYVGDGIALGHDRLAIIDLSENGNQPMFNDDRSVSIVYNGEIYNYRENRDLLIKKGYRFNSETDTEVILRMYEEYGDRCVEYLNGAFAFGIYDSRKELLFLARDRMGEKPLVYAQTDSGFVFASEIPAVKIVQGVDLSYSNIGIGLYMLRNMRHIPAPYTIYNGIFKLEPSCAMTVKKGRVFRKWKYWSIAWKKESANKQKLLSALDYSVKSRMISDVPIGVLLSGGVDSSIVAHGITKSRIINSYALGKDKEDSDLIRARQAAIMFGTNHKEYYFEPEVCYGNFKKVLGIFGEPIMLLPLLYAYELFGHIRDDGIKVVLTGNGADEVFYGYLGNKNLALLTSIINLCPNKLLCSILSKLEKKYDNNRIRDAFVVVQNEAGKRKSNLYRNECKSDLFDLFNVGLEEVIPDIVEQMFDRVFNGLAPKNYIDESNVIGLFIENEHSVTIAADLPAMANSVEARSPFLNHELVELGYGINYRKKVPWCANDRRLKWILKKAVRDRIGDSILFAPKQGFGYNISEEDVLRCFWRKDVDRAFREYNDFDGLINTDYVKRIKNRFDSGDKDVKTIVVAKLYALQLFLDCTSD